MTSCAHFDSSCYPGCVCVQTASTDDDDDDVAATAFTTLCVRTLAAVAEGDFAVNNALVHWFIHYSCIHSLMRSFGSGAVEQLSS